MLRFYFFKTKFVSGTTNMTHAQALQERVIERVQKEIKGREEYSEIIIEF